MANSFLGRCCVQAFKDPRVQPALKIDRLEGDRQVTGKFVEPGGCLMVCFDYNYYIIIMIIIINSFC